LYEFYLKRRGLITNLQKLFDTGDNDITELAKEGISAVSNLRFRVHLRGRSESRQISIRTRSPTVSQTDQRWTRAHNAR